MKWRITEAKRHFSQLVKEAEETPQIILNRERVVAAVVDPETFRAFETWRSQLEQKTIADAFEDLRRICAEESYTLEPAVRADRPNVFVDALADSPV